MAHRIAREYDAVFANAALPTTAAFYMAFALLSQTLQRFLSVCFNLKDWIVIALGSPLLRLIQWQPRHDVEAV